MTTAKRDRGRSTKRLYATGGSKEGKMRPCMSSKEVGSLFAKVGWVGTRRQIDPVAKWGVSYGERG
jgi:hypothetical protein